MAVNKDFTITLDVKRSTSNTEFEVVEGDNANRIFVSLIDDGSSVDLRNCTVLAVFSKSDGHTAQQDNQGNGISMDPDKHNEFVIELYNSSFAPGLVECEVQVLSGSGRDRLITSAKFNFSCRRSIMNADTVQATDEYPILIDLIKRAEATEQALADIDENEDERQQEELQRVASEALRDEAEDERNLNEAARQSLYGKWSNPSAQATSLLPAQGATATVEVKENGVAYTFGIPRGTPSTLQVGTVATGLPGTGAAVMNRGTTADAILDFRIPQGTTGEPGPRGEKGETGANAVITEIGGMYAFQIVDGHLCIFYPEDATSPPPYQINEDGHLIMNLGG